jgi:uncharacterized membrane protein
MMMVRPRPSPEEAGMLFDLAMIVLTLIWALAFFAFLWLARKLAR